MCSPFVLLASVSQFPLVSFGSILMASGKDKPRATMSAASVKTVSLPGVCGTSITEHIVDGLRYPALAITTASGGPLDPMTSQTVTVWYDGACPLCEREIALFRRLDRKGRISFIDVSSPETSCPIDRSTLLERFHASENGQPLVSGAAAFAAMWRAIPWLRPIGEMARHPIILAGIEAIYRQFLKVRPRLQSVARRLSVRT
jgi:predicted DCC family thiol-disulfide oxidoreductase YuxK